MAWLNRPEKNKKYPKYAEVMYDPHKSDITFDIAEGRFFKIDGGYVLLAIVNSISDVKAESNVAGTAISFEIFNQEYERYVNSENPSAKTAPSKMQKILCNYIDGIFEGDLSFLKEENELLKQNFKGLFAYTSSSIIADLVDAKPEAIQSYILKDVALVKPDKIPESLSKVPDARKSGGFSSQSEQQRLEHRLNFVHKALAPYASNPNEFKADIASIASLLAALAADETEFGAVLNREVRWLINLVLGGSK